MQGVRTLITLLCQRSSIRLSVSPPACLSVYMCMSVCLSVCLSVPVSLWPRLFFYLSVNTRIVEIAEREGRDNRFFSLFYFFKSSIFFIFVRSHVMRIRYSGVFCLMISTYAQIIWSKSKLCGQISCAFLSWEHLFYRQFLASILLSRCHLFSWFMA